MNVNFSSGPQVGTEIRCLGPRHGAARGSRPPPKGVRTGPTPQCSTKPSAKGARHSFKPKERAYALFSKEVPRASEPSERSEPPPVIEATAEEKAAAAGVVIDARGKLRLASKSRGPNGKLRGLLQDWRRR